VTGTIRSVATESVVLRSLRYGEADRILHVLTRDHGRLSAIAKGVRRTRSRFGGRLEPLTRVHLELHLSRSGDLHTVTGADVVDPHRRLRGDALALDAAARACDAAGRLFDTPEPHPEVFNLLCNELAWLDRSAGGEDPVRLLANQLAFRMKLLLAAGIAPQLSACAGCGERDGLQGFSGAAGGVVCGACEATAFPLGEEAHAFLAGAIGAPLAAAPAAPPRALAQAERAINATVEHHAHVRLRAAAPGRG
jgi:DNA repair protein RecO (recombination protein O)